MKTSYRETVAAAQGKNTTDLYENRTCKRTLVSWLVASVRMLWSQAGSLSLKGLAPKGQQVPYLADGILSL
jgi:hypothetical protein